MLSIEKEHGSQAYVGGAMSSFHMNPCGPRGSPLGSYSGGFESFPEDPVLDRGIRSFVCPVAHFQNIFQRILRVLVPTILTAQLYLSPISIKLGIMPILEKLPQILNLGLNYNLRLTQANQNSYVEST